MSDADFDDIIDYLLLPYGRINVNKATAEDPALVVASKSDADATSKYRDGKGDFADFDALVQGPWHRRREAEQGPRSDYVLNPIHTAGGPMAREARLRCDTGPCLAPRWRS